MTEHKKSSSYPEYNTDFSIVEHSQEHLHDHDHLHSHDHVHMTFEQTDYRFVIGIALNIAFVATEVTFGIIADSMALLSDAAHNLFDVLGLALAWWAASLGRKKPTIQRTYGYRKAGIMAALANAILILIAVGGILWEAAVRMVDPPKTEGDIIIIVAIIGVFVNAGAAILFLKGRKDDINIRAAFLHLISDAAVSVGVAAAGLLIYWAGSVWIDPLVSIIIALVIVAGTWSLLKNSLALAMDAVPSHIDIEGIRTYLGTMPDTKSFHDLHIWAMSSTEAAMTVHICTDNPWTATKLRSFNEEMEHRFAVKHVTVQVETLDDSLSPCPVECCQDR